MLKILQLFFLSFFFFFVFLCFFFFFCVCLLINYSHSNLPLKDEDTVFNRWRNIQLYWVTCYSKRIHLHYAMVGSKWKKTTLVSEGRENWSCKSGSLSGSSSSLWKHYRIANYLRAFHVVSIEDLEILLRCYSNLI